MYSKLPYRDGGYVGLIGLLITALLIAWWAVTYSPFTTQDSSDDDGSTRTEVQSPIRAAEQAIRTLEARQQDIEL